MTGKLRFFHRRWFQIFGGGLILFIATEEAFRITQNPNFFPTVILLGALLVPVSFVAYVYERIPDAGNQPRQGLALPEADSDEI